MKKMTTSWSKKGPRAGRATSTWRRCLASASPPRRGVCLHVGARATGRSAAWLRVPNFGSSSWVLLRTRWVSWRRHVVGALNWSGPEARCMKVPRKISRNKFVICKKPQNAYRKIATGQVKATAQLSVPPTFEKTCTTFDVLFFQKGVRPHHLLPRGSTRPLPRRPPRRRRGRRPRGGWIY